MGRRTLAIWVTAVAALLVATAPAAASLGTEVDQGRAVAQRLDAGTATCDQLSKDDFEVLGEYVMNRMVGSLAAHQAMNARMDSVMGAANEERMHVLLGERFAGCSSTGMMAGARPGWGAMMSSGMWSWMRNGTWQHMSRADWQSVSNTWMGPGMMGSRGRGWHANGLAIGAGVLLVSMALAAVILVTVRRRRVAGVR